MKKDLYLLEYNGQTEVFRWDLLTRRMCQNQCEILAGNYTDNGFKPVAVLEESLIQNYIDNIMIVMAAAKIQTEEQKRIDYLRQFEKPEGMRMS